MRVLRCAATVLALGVLWPQVALAANPQVNIRDNYYDPASTHAALGDEVYWSNFGGHHTVTSDLHTPPSDPDAPGPFFASGDLYGFGIFSFVVDFAGTFAYHCTFH